MARRTLQQFEERFQEYLELLKIAEYTKLNRVYNDIGKLLTSALNELDGPLSDLRRTQLERFIASATSKQRTMIANMIKEHRETLRNVGAYSYAIEASVLASVTGAAVVHSTKARAIYQAALARPLGATGDLLESFISNLTPYQVGITQKILRKAHVNGWTLQETVRTLRGTKAANYADGLMSRLGKQTMTVVRTSMQHVSSSARQVTWADNSDIVEGYRWVSTLDSRTSEECQELDGQVFALGEGPLPPAHPNCRSTTVAVLNKAFDVLDEGALRASRTGYVPWDMKYPEWLEEYGG